MTPRASPSFSTPRLALGLLGAAWTATTLLDVAHPLWIGVQALSWLGVGMIVLALLPGWRSRAGMVGLTALGLLATPLLSVSGGAPDLRVAVLNTQIARAAQPALHEELQTLSPDVLVLVETTAAEAAEAAALLDLEVTGPVAPGGRGVAVLAAASAPAEQVREGFHQMPAVPLDGVTVVGVHTAAPLTPRLVELWGQDLAHVATALGRPGAVIAAGDFNATAAHPAFRELAGRDCTLPVPTWPMPVSGLHLDHVVVSGADCTGAGTFAVPGTDHRGVWADVAVDQAAGAAAARTLPSASSATRSWIPMSSSEVKPTQEQLISPRT